MSLISALNYVRKAAHVALVVVLMLALGAAGADAARRTDAESKYLSKKTPVAVSENPQVGPASAPETPGGNMAPNSRPTTEQQAVLSAVIAPSANDRSQEKLDGESVLLSNAVSLTSTSCHGISALASLPMATPRSAQLGTLVGAIPSGTM